MTEHAVTDDTGHRDLLTPTQPPRSSPIDGASPPVTSPTSATTAKASATSRSAAASPTGTPMSWPSKTSTTSRRADSSTDTAPPTVVHRLTLADKTWSRHLRTVCTVPYIRE